uniref:Uncharacterized protein n=1 Tax=Megaselia scalaris TaxID=36166 RepID=T1GIA0_MEGSC
MQIEVNVLTKQEAKNSKYEQNILKKYYYQSETPGSNLHNIYFLLRFVSFDCLHEPGRVLLTISKNPGMPNWFIARKSLSLVGVSYT